MQLIQQSFTVQVCDATAADKRTSAGPKIKIPPAKGRWDYILVTVFVAVRPLQRLWKFKRWPSYKHTKHL